MGTEAVMAQTVCNRLTNFHLSDAETGTVEKAVAWVRELFSVRCRAQRDPRDTALSRADTLREAAILLSLGDGVPLTGREYWLIEELWRIDR
jgi:hypothetical protein